MFTASLTACVGGAPSESTRMPPPATGNEAETPVTSDASCETPAFTPTYLPWLRANETPPAPRTTGGTEASDRTLVWFASEHREYEEQYVALTTQLAPHADLEHFEQVVPVRGHDGHVIWIGDPGVGEVSLQWMEREDPCGSFALHMSSIGFSERGAVRKLARVARSLAA
jgi:hypothetical protein